MRCCAYILSQNILLNVSYVLLCHKIILTNYQYIQCQYVILIVHSLIQMESFSINIGHEELQTFGAMPICLNTLLKSNLLKTLQLIILSNNISLEG
jgi:hypothetical protein